MQDLVKTFEVNLQSLCSSFQETLQLYDKVRFNMTNMNLTQLREAVEDRRAWRALVHGVTKSRTRLNNKDSKPYSRKVWVLKEIKSKDSY